MNLPLIESADPTAALAIQPGGLPGETVSGLYVHVPFCFHKCHYCDFYSITHQDERRMSRFVDRVLAESDFWTSAAPRLLPRTVFFGGGTPSLLPMHLMRRLIVNLRGRFDFSGLREWTIEVNPATASRDYLAMLRELGVDRLSFGAQSFDRRDLAVLERHHDPQDVPKSLEAARSAGFDRLNIDLIYAIPGQTAESWSASLEAAIALGTTHLSCYGLTYEPNTPLAVKKRLGRITGTEESVELEMMRHTRRRLSSGGMPAYEISNYAAPGEECRHNLLYWSGGNYIGLGPSAASHVAGWRWRNRPHLGEWESALDAGRLPVGDVEHLTPQRRWGELAMLNLRLTRGINFADFKEQSGHDARVLFAAQIRRLQPTGLIRVDADAIRLNESAIALADAVAAEFLQTETP